MLETNTHIDPAAPVGDFSTEMTLGELADVIEQVQAEGDRHVGPSPILVRRDTKQAWSQAKTLDALKDMAPEKLSAWVDGMNEVAGFAKYRVA